jgi:hypothetical protein
MAAAIPISQTRETMPTDAPPPIIVAAVVARTINQGTSRPATV